MFGVGVRGAGRADRAPQPEDQDDAAVIVRETARMAGAITESLRNIELVKSLGLTFPEIRRLQTYTQQIFELEMLKVRARANALVPAGHDHQRAEAVDPVHPAVADLPQVAHRRRADLDAVHPRSTIFGPLQDLGSVILNYREAEASLQNFDELMAKPIEQRPEVAGRDRRPSSSCGSTTWCFATARRAENAVDRHLVRGPRWATRSPSSVRRARASRRW